MNAQLAALAFVCLVGLTFGQRADANCLQNPCQNGGRCYPGGINNNNDVTSYCMCPSGYTGTLCENQHPCLNYCQNGGRCSTRQTSPTGTGTTGGQMEPYCLCRQGYSGDRCETFPDPCETEPCQNGGTCQPGSTTAAVPGVFRPFWFRPQSRICICPQGFIGPNCEFTDPCVGFTCENGGNCRLRPPTPAVPQPTGVISTVEPPVAYCQCPRNYQGDRCETFVDPCDSSPCKNGATCDGTVTDPREMCTCASGFVGFLCERAEKCSPGWCMNGGSCCERNRPTGFPIRPGSITGFPSMPSPSVMGGAFCTCPSTHNGVRCELEVCQAGYTFSTDTQTCTPCAVDTYKPMRGGQPCFPCPQGTSTNSQTGRAFCSRAQIIIPDQTAPTFSLNTGNNNQNQNNQNSGPRFPFMF